MSRIAAGEQAAFRRVYEAHHKAMVRLAYGVTQDREQAKDIAQDVFMKLLKQSSTWTPRAQLSTWLRQVTLNECLSWRRRLLRRKQRVDVDDAADVDVVEGADVSAIDVVHRNAAKKAFAAAMQKLSPRDRAIVVLHVDEDRAPHEIATLLGVNDNAARVALHRALERLQAAHAFLTHATKSLTAMTPTTTTTTTTRTTEPEGATP